MSVVQWDSVLEDYERRWRVGGFDWSAARAEGMSSRFVAPDAAFKGAIVLAPSACWATIDFVTATSPNVRGEVHVKATADCDSQFLALFFRSTAADGLSHGSAPPGPATQVYSPLLFPLDPPVRLASGEEITVRLHALHSKDSYVFAWELRTATTTRKQMSDARVARAHHA